MAHPGALIHSCGFGVTACHNLLAMEAAGLHGSRRYAGSWTSGSAIRTGLEQPEPIESLSKNCSRKIKTLWM